MRRIMWYLFLTFTLTYLSHGLLAFLSSQNYIEFQSIIGQLLFILGGSSPTIFAIIFIVRHPDGSKIKAFKRRLFSYRHSFFIWGVAIGTPILLAGSYQLLRMVFTKHEFDSSVPFYFYIFILCSSIIFGGIEEIGWRGFLQEEVIKQKRLISTGVIIGVIWGFWHIPLFFIEEVSHSDFAFLPFMLGAIMFSTFLTWLYAKTDSLLLVILFHASINASATIGLRFIFNHSLLTYTIILVFIGVGIWMLFLADKHRITID
ncbi:MAG: CPBP family intramembrane metalloprotease [Candidatus Izimaplasma sp.]|nr:CPBP family intramembrane metalloprotease [Candidatus Izimaplasma bacterium]